MRRGSIEDCAQSPGAIYQVRRVGIRGTVATFRLQHQKAISRGENGALVATDAALFERAG